MGSIFDSGVLQWRHGRVGRAAPIEWLIGAEAPGNQAGGPRAEPARTMARASEPP
jgi:hypothetical protein